MPAHIHRPRSLTALLAAAALLVLPACGGGDDDDEPDTTAGATTEAPATEPATSEDVATEEASTEATADATGAATTEAGDTTATDAGGDTGTGGAAPDEEAVRRAVEDYVAAFAARDGARACELLTDAAAQEVVDAAQGQAADCPAAVELGAERAGEGVLGPLAFAEVGPVTITGDTATTSVGLLGMEQQVMLERAGGEWRIASLPGLQ